MSVASNKKVGPGVCDHVDEAFEGTINANQKNG